MDKKKVINTILTTFGVAAATAAATKAVDFAIDQVKKLREKKDK